MKNINRVWIYALISFIIVILTIPIRSKDRITDIWVTHFVYFFTTVFVLCYGKIPKIKIVGGLLAGILIMIVIDFTLEGFSFDGYFFNVLPLFSYVLGILNGYFFIKTQSYVKKTAIVSASIVYCCISVFILADLFLHYVNHGTFTGKIKRAVPVNAQYVLENNDTITIRELKHEVLILDFWTTSCGVCFRKFPLLEELYSMQKKNNNISVVALNIHIARDTPGMALSMVRERGFNFPVAFGLNSIDSMFGVQTYPVTFVIKNDTIIYRGDIEGVKKIIKQTN